jgi:hypothetical protein
MNFLRNAKALKESFQHTLVDLQNYCVVKAVTYGFKSTLNKPDLQRLGSPYGGWFAPTDEILARFKNKFLISVGLGHDVTFDQALLEQISLL